MITKFNGDILKSGAPVILHQVNCLGVMGAGLAKQIRNKHPSVYTRYKDFAVSRTPDDLMGFSLWTSLSPDGQLPFIVNCFAQRNIGSGSNQTDYDALKQCFSNTLRICKESYNNCIIAIPDHIGCGLAGGDWGIVYSIIEDVFSNYSGDVQIWKLR